MNSFAIISTVYRDEELIEIERLKNEFSKLGLKKYRFYVADCRTANRGYAYGINQGIRKALRDKADTFIIVNPDISVSKLSFEVIKAGLAHFDILGFTIDQDKKKYYGGAIEKNRLSGGLNGTKPKERYAPVDFVSGSLMVIKSEVIKKIGQLNENYFIYYEDVEYCLKAKQAGFKVGIDSNKSYKHFEISNSNNPQKTKLLFWNRLRFFWKYSSLFQKARELLRSPITFYEHLPLLVTSLRQSPFAVSFFSYNFTSLLSKATHFFIFIVLVNSLTPAQYGLYSLVWAFVNMFTPFLDFGTTTYGLVYGNVNKPQDKTLYSLRFYLSFAVYLAIVIGSFFMFPNPLTRIFVLLTATTVFSSSLSGSYLIYNSLRQKVVLYSYLSLAFNVVFSILVVSALLLNQGIGYLFASYAFCYISYALLNAWLLRNQLNFQLNPKRWFAILKQSLIFVVIGFLATFYFKADLFILKRFFNNEAVGIYSAGLKFLDALLILPGSYNVIVIPIMRGLAPNRRLLQNKVIKDLFFLLVFGTAITLVFYLMAPFILPLVLKKNFGPSLEIARLISFTVIPLLLTSVFYNALYSLKKEKYVMFILVIQSVLSLSSYWILVPWLGYWGAVYTKLALEFFNTAVASVFLIYALKKYGK